MGHASSGRERLQGSLKRTKVPADELIAPATAFTHLDSKTVLSRQTPEFVVYPAVDPFDSTSRRSP